MIRYNPNSENVLKILIHNYTNIGVKCKYSPSISIFLMPWNYRNRFLLVVLKEMGIRKKYLAKIFCALF